MYQTLSTHWRESITSSTKPTRKASTYSLEKTSTRSSKTYGPQKGCDMRVILKEPGCAPREIEIDGTLEEYQRLVGGYIEHHTLTNGIGILFDEEGKLKGKKPNIYLDDLYDVIVGNVVVVGEEGEEFTEVPEEMLPKVMFFLRSSAV